MKRNIFTVLALIVLFAIGCKDDDDEQQPEQEVKYSVTYKVDVSGGEDLTVSFSQKDNQINQLSGIVTPWEQKLGEFSSGDSVIFDMSFKTIQNQQVSYNYSIDVEKSNGEYLTGNQGSQTIAPADTSFIINRGWEYRIP